MFSLNADCFMYIDIEGYMVYTVTTKFMFIQMLVHIHTESIGNGQLNKTSNI